MLDSKEHTIQRAIESSETPGGVPTVLKILFDKRASEASADLGLVEPAQSLCTFAQWYRTLVESRTPAATLRHRLSF